MSAKLYTTNYFNTFIEVSEDCPVQIAVAPPEKEPKSAARIEYEMLIDAPYRFASDDVLYASNGERRGVGREDFFSKGQPCFRASALPKRYGWGIHSDAEGKIALVAMGSEEYRHLASDQNLKHLHAMRTGKK